jgi:hypothetical protein
VTLYLQHLLSKTWTFIASMIRAGAVRKLLCCFLSVNLLPKTTFVLIFSQIRLQTPQQVTTLLYKNYFLFRAPFFFFSLQTTANANCSCRLQPVFSQQKFGQLITSRLLNHFFFATSRYFPLLLNMLTFSIITFTEADHSHSQTNKNSCLQ